MLAQGAASNASKPWDTDAKNEEAPEGRQNEPRRVCHPPGLVVVVPTGPRVALAEPRSTLG